MPPIDGAAEIDAAVTSALEALVAFPTESRTPNMALIEHLAERLEGCGARASTIAGPAGRANLLASFGPVAAGGLLLSGHTDVVPAGAGWATDPYSLSKIGDALYGRGTADMKGFIAAMLVALERLPMEQLSRPLHVVLSFDEEVGCVGVRHVLDHLAERPDVRPDVIAIGEPTMMLPCRSHLGKFAQSVEVQTAPAHSSLSHTKPSAITTAMRLIDALVEIQRQNRPLDEPEVTVNVGTISGGTAVNVIAARCSFDFEVRFTVDFDPDEVLQPFSARVQEQRAELGDAGAIRLTDITEYPALRTPADDPWLRRVERIADRGPAGSISYGSEGGLFAAALAAPVVICGPGDIGVAHRPDEYVTVDQLRRCHRFVAALVDDLCIESRSGALAGGEVAG